MYKRVSILVSDIKEGNIYGRLTVLKKYETIKTYKYGIAKKSMCECVCVCGSNICVESAKLTFIKSCGCYRKNRDHGESKGNIYSIWSTMKGRCYCITNKQYPDYGGRGIKMCVGIDTYLKFKKIIGERPTRKHSVDRIDNNGNYCCGECSECLVNSWPKNIKWATAQEQSYNKRNNLIVSYNGETMCLSELCRKYDLRQPLIHQRITTLGWDLETAILTPVRRSNRYIKKGKIGRNQYSK